MSKSTSSRVWKTASAVFSLGLSVILGCSTEPAPTETPTDPKAAQIERGRYIVEVLADCGRCHTPLNEDGSRDQSRHLAGRKCYIAPISPLPGDLGCLHTKNITSHETGLKNRTDSEVEDMLVMGLRPNGDFLHQEMPYWIFGNWSEADLDAVVAYLRTVPPIDHKIDNSDALFYEVKGPVAAIDVAALPTPDSASPNLESAQRGRYIATQAGTCLDCHTPRHGPGLELRIDLTRAFEGGRELFARDFGLASPPWPTRIFSANLTPHATGLEGWTADDIVRAMKEGVDKDDEGLCAPMPAGPDGALAELTDEDALDLANYFLAIAPKETVIAESCESPL